MYIYLLKEIDTKILLNNESKKIKEVNAISKNEPKQLIKQEKNHLEENKMDDKNDFKVPATNQEENKKDDEKKKKESEKVNKAYIEEDKKRKWKYL